MPSPNKLLLALAVASALTACGGGGSDASAPVVITPPTVTPTALKGVMVDGYVRGATVFCDTNNNGTLDTGETSVTTDSTGAFEFTGGCSAAIVGFGGTNVDTGFAFSGTLKAPAGSSVITPLTTLLVGTGLTASQLNALLSLPTGTDVTKVDPANGQNDELFKKTLAVQQLLDSLARTTAAKAGNSDVKTVYTRIASDFAKALATQSASAQVIKSSGDLDATVLTTVVGALPDVVALKLVSTDLGAAVGSLIEEAQQFAKATPAQIVAISKSLQDPARATVNLTATTNYLALSNDSIQFNGNRYTTAELTQGVQLTGLDTVGFNFTVVGGAASENVSSVALELTERGGSNRRLQLMIDGVTIVPDVRGQVSVTVPEGAKVYAYGATANGTEVNLTISDLTFSPIRVVDNGFTLNYTNMVNKVVASTDVAGRTTAERFLGIKGSFDVKLVVSGINVRKVDGSAFPTGFVQLVNSTKRVNGALLSGQVSIN
jgi:hypothetical protein